MKSDLFDLLFLDGCAVEQHIYLTVVFLPQDPEPGRVLWRLAAGLSDCLRPSPLLHPA